MYRGQANIISLVILVGLVVVLGVGLISYFSTYIANISSENILRNAIQNEIANTVVYKENDNGEALWLGLIRIDGTSGLYYMLIINTSSCTIQYLTDKNIIQLNLGSIVSKSVDPNSIYLLGSNGDHFPIKIYYRGQSYITIYEISVEAGGKPKLIGPITYKEITGCIQVIFFTSVNNNYYEVARIYV